MRICLADLNLSWGKYNYGGNYIQLKQLLPTWIRYFDNKGGLLTGGQGYIRAAVCGMTFGACDSRVGNERCSMFAKRCLVFGVLFGPWFVCVRWTPVCLNACSVFQCSGGGTLFVFIFAFVLEWSVRVRVRSVCSERVLCSCSCSIPSHESHYSASLTSSYAHNFPLGSIS